MLKKSPKLRFPDLPGDSTRVVPIVDWQVVYPYELTVCDRESWYLWFSKKNSGNGRYQNKVEIPPLPNLVGPLWNDNSWDHCGMIQNWKSLTIFAQWNQPCLSTNSLLYHCSWIPFFSCVVFTWVIFRNFSWASPCNVILGENMWPFWWYHRGIHSFIAVLGGVLSTIKDTHARGILWWTNIAMEIGPFQDLFSIQDERFQLLLIFTPQDIFPPKLMILAPMCFKQQSQLPIYCRSFCPSTAMSTPSLKWVSSGVNTTVDGRNPANQLRLVDYPIIYEVSYIPGGSAGFLNHQQ